MKKTLIILILLISQISHSQNFNQFKRQFEKDIKEIRKTNGKYTPSVNDYNEFYQKIPADITSEIHNYQSDTMIKIRKFVFDMYYATIKKAIDENLRQQITYYFVQGVLDPDMNLSERNAKYLTHLNKSDYNQQSKDLLASYYTQSSDIYQKTTRIVGFLDMADQASTINELLNDTIPEKTKWELRLTLARLGDENQANYCTQFTVMQGVNNRIVKYLFADLVYTRSKVAFDYMIQELKSDEQNCIPANPYLSDNIVCGYRIMELLANVVEDFPYETYNGVNQLKTDNYDKALVDVREWFDAVGDNYVILKDKY